jgi:hypothetical protein
MAGLGPCWFEWGAMLVFVTPVLLLTGPVGAGKSAVLHEAGALLIEASVPHATVVLGEVAGCWPVPPEDPVQRVACVGCSDAAMGGERLPGGSQR